MLYGRVDDRLYLHGSTGAGALRQVAAGAPANLCVTLIDGIVVADNLFNSSANYRSAVVRGHPARVSADEAYAALTAMSDRLIPGRSAEVPPAQRQGTRRHSGVAAADHRRQLDRQGAHRATGRARTSIPDAWAGVVPMTTVYGTPIPAPWVPQECRCRPASPPTLNATSPVNLAATTRPNSPGWSRERPRSDGIGRRAAGIPAAPRPRTPGRRLRRVAPSRPTSHIAVSACPLSTWRLSRFMSRNRPAPSWPRRPSNSTRSPYSS